MANRCKCHAMRESCEISTMARNRLMHFSSLETSVRQKHNKFSYVNKFFLRFSLNSCNLLKFYLKFYKKNYDKIYKKKLDKIR